MYTRKNDCYVRLPPHVWMFSRTASMQHLNPFIAVVIPTIAPSRTFWKAIIYGHLRVTELNSSQHMYLNYSLNTRCSCLMLS